MRTGMMFVAAAGPLSNLLLAGIGLVTFAVMARGWPQAPAPYVLFVQCAVFMNVVLAAFNMLPVLPLDGSRVADALVPLKLRPYWQQWCQLGPLPLVAVLLLPLLLNVSLFAPLFQLTAAVMHIAATGTV